MNDGIEQRIYRRVRIHGSHWGGWTIASEDKWFQSFQAACTYVSEMMVPA